MWGKFADATNTNGDANHGDAGPFRRCHFARGSMSAVGFADNARYERLHRTQRCGAPFIWYLVLVQDNNYSALSVNT